MNEIIAVSKTVINQEETNSVSARDLHDSLGVKKPFTQWIEPKLKDSVLESGKDYIEVFNQEVKNPEGGRPSKEYILTLDTAKHIAMMSRTPKAKAVRDYFIKVEKQYRQGESQSNKEFATLAYAMLESQKQMMQMMQETLKEIRTSRVEVIEEQSDKLLLPLPLLIDRGSERRGYSGEEDQLILLLRSQGHSNVYVAKLLGRSNMAIRIRHCRLMKGVNILVDKCVEEM